jgi:hypothetical protein
LLIVLFSACKSRSDNTKSNIVNDFIADVKNLEKDTNKNPITEFKKLADRKADEKIVFTKENISKVLSKARDFKHCIIATENHTLVKIENIDDCQQSGSWKTCMPTVKGYIKKSKLNFKDDYMNNVIGTPDGQERIAYFFAKIEKGSAQIADLLEFNSVKFNLSKLNFKSNSVKNIKEEFQNIEQEIKAYKEYSLFENGLIDPSKLMVDLDKEGLEVIQYYYIENDEKVILKGEGTSYITCYLDEDNNIIKVDFTDGSDDHFNIGSYYFYKDSKMPFFYLYDTWVMNRRNQTRLYFKQENQSLLILKALYKSNQDFSEIDDYYDVNPEKIDEIENSMLNYQKTLELLEGISLDIKSLKKAEIISSNHFYYQNDEMSKKMKSLFFESGFQLKDYFLKNHQNEEVSPDYIDTTKKYFFSSMNADSTYALFKFYNQKIYNINGVFPEFNDIVFDDNTFSILNPMMRTEGGDSKLSIYSSSTSKIDSIIFYNFDGNRDGSTISLINEGEKCKLTDSKRVIPYYKCGL